MIVDFLKNGILQHVHKSELINRDQFGILKGKSLQKYDNILS